MSQERVLRHTMRRFNDIFGLDGDAAFPASVAPATATTFAAALREVFDQAEKSISSGAAVIALATTPVFAVAGGAIMIMEIISRCVTANGAGQATTAQWTWAGTLGTATTFTGASATLASLAAGDLVITDLTALTTAPLIMTSGISAVLGSPTTQRRVITNGPGNVSLIGGTAASTGTWTHHMRYRPLGRGVSVSAAF